MNLNTKSRKKRNSNNVNSNGNGNGASSYPYYGAMNVHDAHSSDEEEDIHDHDLDYDDTDDDGNNNNDNDNDNDMNDDISYGSSSISSKLTINKGSSDNVDINIHGNGNDNGNVNHKKGHDSNYHNSNHSDDHDDGNVEEMNEFGSLLNTASSEERHLYDPRQSLLSGHRSIIKQHQHQHNHQHQQILFQNQQIQNLQTQNSNQNQNQIQNQNQNQNQNSNQEYQYRAFNRKKSFQKENNRIISLFLFAIVFVCILAIAFLASPLSKPGGGGGSSSGSIHSNVNDNNVNTNINAKNNNNINANVNSNVNNNYDNNNYDNSNYESDNDQINPSNDNDNNNNNNNNNNSNSSNNNNNNSNDDDDDYYNDDSITSTSTIKKLSTSSHKVYQSTISKIPFTPISREAQSMPASSIINPLLFHPLLRVSKNHHIHANSSTSTSGSASTSTSGLQPLLKTPFPTGAFYTNLVLSQTTSNESTSYPIMVYPYSYKWSPTKVIISYPYIHRLYDSISIRDIFQPDLSFSVEESISENANANESGNESGDANLIQNRFVSYYDNMSVRLRYTSKSEDELMEEDYLDYASRKPSVSSTSNAGSSAGSTSSSSSSSTSSSTSSSSSSTNANKNTNKKSNKKQQQQNADDDTLNTEHGFETYLVQGSPYITIKYTNSTPMITPLSIFKSFHCMTEDDDINSNIDADADVADNVNDAKNNGGVRGSSGESGSSGSNRSGGKGTSYADSTFGICSTVTPSSAMSKLPPSQQDITLEGIQFILQTQENLKWMVFASEPIELTLDGISKHTIRSTTPYNGILRIALIPPPPPPPPISKSSSNAENPTLTTTVIQQPPYTSLPSLNNSTTVDTLIYYSHLYPVGGSISWEYKQISLPSLSSSSSSAVPSSPSSNTETAESTSSSSSAFQLEKDPLNDIAGGVSNVWDAALSSSSIYPNNNNTQSNSNKDANKGTWKSFFRRRKDSNGDDNVKNEERTIGTVTFQYDVQSMYDDKEKNSYLDTTISTANVAATTATSSTMSSGGWRKMVKNDLLMMALPHHVQVLPSNTIVKDFDSKYHCIKGTLTPIVGMSWTYDELLTNTEFDDVNNEAKLKSMNENIKETILDQVEKDLERVLPTLTENVYGFGKQVARLANLVKIIYEFQQISNDQDTNADDAKNSTSKDGSNVDNNYRTKLEFLLKKATDLLHKYLTAFLDEVNSDNLVYDANFGGIITRNGLLNMQADFGNGWYNDHHFHYGYILYASAIMAKVNSTFVHKYGLHVDSLLNDVAHGSNQDSNDVEGSFFPFTRHKSWFDGHSYASGLFPFADGKSQESSSEAVNCYYGAYLWSLSSANLGGDRGKRYTDNATDRINFMKLLLAMEIRSTKTYWHMVPPSETEGMELVHSMNIYNPSFEESLMVGNLGMMDVTIATWFGTEKLYVHMINFLPVTAITKELFDPDYVELEFNKVLDPIYDEVEMAWRGYVVSDKAILDPSTAWDDATQLRSFELDSALSQSQVYYWISTMDGFTPPYSSTQNPSGTGDSSNSSVHDQSGSSCYSNPACTNIGLAGECCPTVDGTMLGCCNQASPPKTPQQQSVELSNFASSDSSCGSNEACASIGLVGKCCPGVDGAMLRCCNK